MANRVLSDYGAFKKVLDSANSILALTGAGVSAESGIPVFRGAGGLWRMYEATSLATPEAFEASPALVWEFYHYRREVAFNSKPNNAHIALAKYEKLCKEQGRSLTVLTQNVDGLHIAAGSENVVEMHGSLRKIICTECKTIEVNTNSPICEALRVREDPNQEDKNLPDINISDLPKCAKCGSLARPYIVWFGESLDPDVMEKINELIGNCDLCLLIGTSSIVYPAAMYDPVVVGRGKPAAEFNLNKDPAQDYYSFYFSGPCGTTLPKALGIDL